MSVESIVDLGDDYQAVIHGVTMTVPKDIGNRHYQMIVAAIDGGEAVASPAAPTLEEQRAAAILTREAFLQAVAAEGIISWDEAEEAADGSWPASFATFLSGMTQAERVEARALWARGAMIRRDSPLLASVAADQGVSDGQLDAMFGI